jgi:lysosomal alpha-glucosidase
MNEPANFCEGFCGGLQGNFNNLNSDYINQQFEYPYRIGHEDLEHKTLPPHLLHYGKLTH